MSWVSEWLGIDIRFNDIIKGVIREFNKGNLKRLLEGIKDDDTLRSIVAVCNQILFERGIKKIQ